MSDYEFTSNSGVVFELVQDKKTGSENIVITVPTYLLKEPRKARALKLEKKGGKETGWYEVPKADSFIAETKRLKSNHTMMLQVYRKIDDKARYELYQQGIAQGLKVHPINVKDESTIETIEEPKDGVIRTTL